MGADIGVAWQLRRFLLRELRQMKLAEALEGAGNSFVKHSFSKALPAGICNSESLAQITARFPPTTLVHVGEPVERAIKYRCFVTDREVAAIIPYRQYGEVIKDHSCLLRASRSEINDASHLAASVLGSASVEYLPAFVLDVGIIVDRGWAVVECNECWAPGIYACDSKRVQDTLLRASVRTIDLTGDERYWDFQSHYLAAYSRSQVGQ